jgi:hypothetical protein
MMVETYIVYMHIHVIDSMERSPTFEADSYLASQEICRILKKTKVHYHLQNNAPLGRILSQLNPIHTITSYSFQIHLNIMHPSQPRSSKCPSSTQVFPIQILPRSCYHTPCSDHPVGRNVQIVNLVMMHT